MLFKANVTSYAMMPVMTPAMPAVPAMGACDSTCCCCCACYDAGYNACSVLCCACCVTLSHLLKQPTYFFCTTFLTSQHHHSTKPCFAPFFKHFFNIPLGRCYLKLHSGGTLFDCMKVKSMQVHSAAHSQKIYKTQNVPCLLLWLQDKLDNKTDDWHLLGDRAF